MITKSENRVIPKWVLVCIPLLIIVTLAYIAVSQLETTYTVKIAYTIQPATQLEPMNPSQESAALDLGVIASGSKGEKGFGNITTLYLPGRKPIELELDPSTLNDFERISVHVWALNAAVADVGNWIPTGSFTLPSAGSYDIYVLVRYTAKNVDVTTYGEVELKISWPLVIRLP